MKLKKATTQTINYPSKKEITPLLLTIALSFSASANPQIDSENNQTKELPPIETVELLGDMMPVQPVEIEPYPENEQNCTALPTPPTKEQNQSTIIKPIHLKGKIAYKREEENQSIVKPFMLEGKTTR